MLCSTVVDYFLGLVTRVLSEMVYKWLKSTLAIVFKDTTGITDKTIMWLEHTPYNNTNYEFGFADIEAPEITPVMTPAPEKPHETIVLDLVRSLSTNITTIVHVVKVWWRNGTSIGYSA